jgi:hypothetical protein
MALGSNELFSSASRGAHPRLEALATRVVHLEDNAGSVPVELPIGTPLAFDTSTSQWCVYEDAGANGRGTIRGFVYGTEQSDDDADDVLMVVLYRGRVHRDDVNTAAIRAVLGGAGGTSEAELDIALKVRGLRDMGIDVVGLAGVAP